MSAKRQVKPSDFFVRHPVFRYEEFVAAHAGQGGRSRQTSASALKQHVVAGRLLHLHRGLYATVPRGADAESHLIDPYLVATQLANDAVVAWYAALQFHGRREPGRLVKDWNLVVPERVLTRSWAEVR